MVRPSSTSNLDLFTSIPESSTTSPDIPTSTIVVGPSSTSQSLDFKDPEESTIPSKSSDLSNDVTFTISPDLSNDVISYFTNIDYPYSTIPASNDYLVPTSVIPTPTVPSGDEKRSLPDPGPLQESSTGRDSFLNLCPNDCDKLDSMKAGSKTLTNFAFRGSQRLVNPGTIEEMKKGVALMAMTMQTIGHFVPRQGRLIKLQGQMAKAALDRLGQIEEAAIWVRLTAHCCQTISCCLVSSRNAWRPVNNWFKCLKPDGLGFDVRDHEIGANIIACVKAALEEEFNCTPEASVDIIPAE
jgi:hypothetical protein